MKLTLEKDGKETVVVSDDITAYTYRKVISEENSATGIIEKKPVGVPMIIITIDMPTELRERIDILISSYCNI